MKMRKIMLYLFEQVSLKDAQSPRAEEYADCFSAEVQDPPPAHPCECPDHDTKQSDCEVPVML